MEIRDFLSLFSDSCTPVAGYEKYRHSKLYLQWVKNNIIKDAKGKPGDWKLCANTLNLGEEKFLRKFHDGFFTTKEPIPMKLLELCGIDHDVLLRVLDFDIDEYEQQVKNTIKPESFRYFLMPTVYPVVQFPENINEEEAIHFCREFVKDIYKDDFLRYTCRPPQIQYKDLKTINVYPNHITTHFHRPKIIISNGNQGTVVEYS